ncbi:Pimeloyl-ACP methyl ester carboxylesterase [Haloechinothrix alba]|uniref:Pimeloyl-ACP methyl ester carboxylesterase n=1 Tax=Haloechinothrix alba TaxID=664784 RepID=A0A238VSU4_9PSEU|nr:alpha/beta hydrolase [Haloechinothrix alba]SNR37217.1 Pimeloyl-ACP methyl ester carboxylesterase [Haloechinothrix alba]
MSVVNRRLLGVVGGLGAVATGAAATALAVGSRRGTHGDPYADEALGRLAPDRTTTVAADDGTPLHVEEIEPLDGGKPDVTLIGVHGFALSVPSWHFQRRDLASLTLPRVRQVYYDHRSHGSSGRADADTSTIEQLASDVHAVLRAVAPNGPVVLAGHSLGGMTIMELAQQQPELFGVGGEQVNGSKAGKHGRVRGVSLIATAAGEVASTGVSRPLLSRYNPLTRGVSGLADWQPGLVEFVRAAGGQLTRQAVRRLAFGSADVSPSLVDFMLRMLGETPVRDLVSFIGAFGEHHRYTALAALSHTRVQVIGGDADMLTPFSHSERIAEEVGNAELIRVHGAGHMVHLEYPEEVNSSLIDLLQRSCEVGSDETGTGRSVRERVTGWFGR